MTPSRNGATVARVVVDTDVRSGPGRGPVIWRAAATTAWGGGAQWLLVRGCSVVERSGRPWLEVLLPTRPNWHVGWIKADHVLARRSAYWIEVSTGRAEVTVFRSGVVARRFRAVVGAPATPTPHGLFAIAEAVRQPRAGGFVGPWVIHLTAHSTVLENFGGGPGRVGIHGRGGASLADPLGSARSHGCIRVDNDDVVWLARNVPPGSPVSVG